MAKIRLYGDSSGYIDLDLPTSVSSKTIYVDTLISGDSTGAVTLSGATLSGATIDSATVNNVVATGNTQIASYGDSNITLDFSTYQNFIITLTGNATLVNPTTEKQGQSGTITVIQDATGSRTLSYTSEYNTAGGLGLTLSTAANARDQIPYFVSFDSAIDLGTPQLGFA